MRKKFKIYYPKDHHDEKKRGKLYRPPNQCMVVMSTAGVFFLYDNSSYYPSIKRLSDVLPIYDVVWK